MFYILHGEDELGRSELVAELKARMGDETALALNTSVLDGKSLTLAELMDTCNALPFLGERRLVIVQGLLSRLAGRAGEEEGAPEEAGWRKAYIEGLVEYLPQLPPTTRLVFLEDKALSAKNPLVALARKIPGCYAKEYPLPQESALPAWIAAHAQTKGTHIEPAAAQELADFVGGNLRLLDSELEKLATFAGGRAIAKEDVEALVSYARERNIFALVEALARGQRGKALAELEGLLAGGEPPLRILGMIAWQVRMLLGVKDLAARGNSSEEIRKALSLRDFQVRRLREQAERFTLDALKRAMRQVLEADIAIKGGELAPELALEVLVSTLGKEEGHGPMATPRRQAARRGRK